MFPEGRACVRKSVASLRHPTGMFSLSWGQTGQKWATVRLDATIEFDLMKEAAASFGQQTEVLWFTQLLYLFI